MKHVVFFDGECPLCNRAVRFILSADRRHLFGFAPLQGETAKKKLEKVHLDKLDTLVLLTHYATEKEETLIEGRAVLRICWLLGGGYAWVGWLSFLPSFLFDAVYRLIARYRYRLFKTKKPVNFSGRLLP